MAHFAPPTQWILKPQPTTEQLNPEVIAQCGGSPVLAKLLYQRGLTTPKAIEQFINLKDYKPTSPWELPEMDLGIKRVVEALEKGQHILIYGDFDVDGQTGTSILYETLTKLNANVSFYIPDRATEGHGLHVATLLRLVSARSVRLVITTDTGIGNFNEISLLKGLGVDTIVTDHHENPENLPPSVANITPKSLSDPEHPLTFLSGAGVAYKFCEALWETLLPTLPDDSDPHFPDQLLDLTAIGLICDLMPLLRENRFIVIEGLKRIQQRSRPGVREILAQAGVDPEAPINSETVGFTIGPRLNALGRLDVATDAVHLLTGHDPDHLQTLATRLEHLNRKRQELCDKTHLEAQQHLSASGGLQGKKAIALASPGWNPGIIGIVASRLIDQFHVPVFMMVVDESKGQIRGSARSIPAFDMHECLNALGHFFIHFGGHPGAGGFALEMEKFEAFREALYAYCDQKLSPQDIAPRLMIDTQLHWSQLNLHLLDLIEQMAPFGQDNPSPRFWISGCKVSAQRALGSSGKHLKVILQGHSKGGTSPEGTTGPQGIDALLWNVNGQSPFTTGESYDFVVTLQRNTFGNKGPTLQLYVEDHRPEGAHTGAKAQLTPTVIPSAKAVTPQSSLPPRVETSESIQIPHSVFSDEGPTGRTATIQWIDHRNREALERFVSQLMLPKGVSEGEYLIFHEGKALTLPFIDPSRIIQRNVTQTADTLILWDLPPDPWTFKALLDTVSPKTLHVVGGKFQSIPLFMSPKDFLRGVYQTLRKQLPLITEESPLTLTAFASQLASSTTVTGLALTVLQTMDLIETSVSIPGGDDALIIQLKPVNGQGTPPPEEQVSFLALHHALAQVSQFRNWLLDSPLDRIKAFVACSPSSTVGTGISLPPIGSSTASLPT